MAGCSRQDGKPKAIDGPIDAPKVGELPDAVLGWVAAGDPRNLLQNLGALVFKNLVGPVRGQPLDLEALLSKLLAEIGLNDPRVLDLHAPLALVLLDPRRFPTFPVALALVTAGKQPVVEALRPAWRTGAEVDGITELRRTFQRSASEGGGHGGGSVEIPVYLHFEGPVAMFAFSRESLLAAKSVLLEVLANRAPVDGIAMGFRTDRLRADIQEALALNRAMLEQTAVAGSSRSLLPIQFLSGAFSVLQQSREVGLAISVKPESGRVYLGLLPEQGSFFHRLLAAQNSSARGSLGRLLPADMPISASLDIQWGLLKEDLLALGPKIAKLDRRHEMPDSLGGHLRELVDLVGERFAFAEDIDLTSGLGGLRVLALLAVRDSTRFREVMIALIADARSMEAGGSRSGIEGPKDLGQRHGVSITGLDLVFGGGKSAAEVLPDLQKILGGDRMRLAFAAWEGVAAIAFGNTAQAEIEGLLDRAFRKEIGGLVDSAEFQSVSAGLADNADGWLFVAPMRIIRSGFGLTMAAQGLPGVGESAPPPVDRQSIGDGDIFTRLDVVPDRAVAGQQITATLTIYSRVGARVSLIRWPKMDEFFTEDRDVSSAKEDERWIEDVRYQTKVLDRKVLFPRQPGEFTLGSVEVEVEAGNSPFLAAEKRTLRTRPVRLKVESLPAQGAIFICLSRDDSRMTLQARFPVEIFQEMGKFTKEVVEMARPSLPASSSP